MNPHFRIATREDLPAIVAIYNATIPGRMVTADLEPVSVEDRLAWFEAHRPASRPLWVVDSPEHSGLAAWLSFTSFYGRLAYDATAEVSLYVDEKHRGVGLGRALLRAAIARAPEFSVHTLLGFIFGHNDPSLSLFESEGFARWGCLPCVARLDGVERDLLILGRRAG